MLAVLRYVYKRPMMFIMATIGGLLFVSFVLRAEETRREVVGRGGIKERIIKQEKSNPCNDLTTRECALKLFQSLRPEERSAIERRVVAEERRAIRTAARQRIARREADRSSSGAGLSGSSRPTSPSSPTVRTRPPASPGGSGGSGGGSSGSGGQQEQNAPQSGSTPPNSVNPVTVDVPPVGPIDVPPITTPSVPCLKTPLTTC